VSATLTHAQDNSAVADITAVNTPAAGSGLLDTTKTWEASVDALANSVLSVTGLNPDSATGPSTVLYEDLYTTISSSAAEPWGYLGYFTLDINGGSTSLSFTGADVPEPNTVTLFAGAGLVLVSLSSWGRKLIGKVA
jgi:hypothetical protein